MDDETLNRIEQITDELDAAVPRKRASVGTVVEVKGHSACADDIVVRANRRGYMRLAVELLRRAVEPPGQWPPGRLDYLMTPTSEFRFLLLDRTDDPAVRDDGVQRWQVRAMVLGGALVVAVVLVLAGIGLISLLR